MKNLSNLNNEEAGRYIQEELFLAGIPTIRKDMIDKFLYSTTGKLRDWVFKRTDCYWIVSAPIVKGLPLKVAIKLHEKKYPINGAYSPKIYGEVVRTVGHAGGSDPRSWAKPDPDKYERVIQNSRKKIKFKTLEELTNILSKKHVPLFIDCYHIDNQVGLNEFAKTIKCFYKNK